MNLRGVKESGTVFAIPTYGFVAVMFRDDRLGGAADGDRRCAGGGPMITVRRTCD